MLLLSLSVVCKADAGGGQRQVCDVAADYALGVEDYPETLRLHREVVREQPSNALAHYHLGFVEGILGHRRTELSEYQRAAALGLKRFGFFPEPGTGSVENGELDAATDSLQWAVLLGLDYSESHYNLALAFERRGLIADAEGEMPASLRLNPSQPDARNSLAVIFAEEEKTARASLLWGELVREAPDYEPARKNLGLLGAKSRSSSRDGGRYPPPPAAAVKPQKNANRICRQPNFSRHWRDRIESKYKWPHWFK